MPCRIEKDPKRCARLVIMLRGAELEDFDFDLGLVEVVDVHVDVHLLRN